MLLPWRIRGTIPLSPPVVPWDAQTCAYSNSLICLASSLAAGAGPGARRAILRPSTRSSPVTNSDVPTGRPVLSARRRAAHIPNVDYFVWSASSVPLPSPCAARKWATISIMGKQLEAVYEKGVLRRLQPLGLRDQQHVMVTVSEIPDYQSWANSQLRELGSAPGLEAIQRQLAGIPGSISDFVTDERGEQ
jgi:predicted DNA-binding antitoxin AbrB/MazE fold protein